MVCIEPEPYQLLLGLREDGIRSIEFLRPFYLIMKHDSARKYSNQSTKVTDLRYQQKDSSLWSITHRLRWQPWDADI